MSYKVCIVGFAHVHINDVAKHFYDHPEIDLVGCADIAPAHPELKPGAIYTREWNIKYCSEHYHIPVYPDWQKMLLELKPDLCVVNSENCHHVAITEFCATHGIGVCIEKPMATTYADGLKMARICQANGTFLMVNWPVTWNPGLQMVKKLIDQGVIGDVIEVKTRMGHTGPLGRGAKHKIAQTAEPMTEEEKTATWWHQTKCGGGAMADYCCYGSVVSCWYAGEDAVAAMGMRVNSMTTTGDAEDNSAMFVRFPSVYAVIEGTWTTINHTFKSPIVYGTKGAIVGDYKTGEVTVYHEDGTVEKIENDPLPEELRDVACGYVAYRKTGKIHFTALPEFNLKALAILDAGIRSADSGKVELVSNPHWQIG